jgi:hypothetical protein
VADRNTALHAVAEYVAGALAYPLGDLNPERARLLGALGIERDATVAETETALRKALGALVPGEGELAAAIRDTPILVENYGYDDSTGAFTATAMLPDELAAVLLDKARDEAATAAGTGI